MKTDTDDLFAEAPVGYAEVDADGVVVSANRRFLELTGRSADDVGSLTYAGVLAAGDRIFHETHVLPALQMHGRVDEIAVELVQPDGTTVPALVSANLREGRKGPVVRTIVFPARDRRRYEQELLRARREAEGASARATELARTLQQSFVPPASPHVPGLELVGVYRPAGDGSEVGGDFYDVFPVSSGEWIVVLGDVCGRGVEAAVVTSFVRDTVRSLAVQWESPAGALRALNTALLDHHTDRFCTVVVVRLLKDGDQWLATISSGGHPLPLYVAADGSVVEVGAAGSLIGVLAVPQLDESRVTIRPGEGLVVFTDGVTDARRGDEPFGLDRLVDLVSSAGSPAEVTSSVLASVLDFQDGHARDDIALLALRVAAEDAEPESAASGEPTDPEARIRALLEAEGDTTPD